MSIFEYTNHLPNVTVHHHNRRFTCSMFERYPVCTERRTSSSSAACFCLSQTAGIVCVLWETKNTFVIFFQADI